MSLALISKSNFKYIVITVSIVILALFLNKYASETSSSVSYTNSNPAVFSDDDLAKYNGIHNEKLYLSVIGSVFDVTEGRKHYAKGSSYHYFIGKDGSRALVTGDFKDESSNKDNVIDLSCDELMTITHWRRTFKQKYKQVGFLAGRYYDKNGVETVYMNELKDKVKRCKEEKEEVKKQNQLYPPCNMAWTEDDGTRVWCSKMSGGVERSWEGVPRQLFTPGEEVPRCVCVNLDNINSSMLKEYEGCSSTSTYCYI